MRYVAVDIETTVPNINNPIPVPVCIQWYDGERAYISKDVWGKMAEFLDNSIETPIIFHNAGFDLGHFVHNHIEKKQEAMTKIFRGKVYDTYIRECLLDISTAGKTLGQASLDKLVKRYLGLDITEDKKDPDSWRYRYGELLDVPIEEWPQEAITYALQDVELTYKVFIEQDKQIQPEGESSANTEKLQIMASVVLTVIANNGLNVSEKKVAELRNSVENAVKEPIEVLISEGLASYKKDGSLKKEKKQFQAYIKEAIPSYNYTTETGQLSTGKKHLKYIHKNKIINAWKEFLEYEKLLTTYIPALEEAVSGPTKKIYPGYNALVSSGRVSSRKQNNVPSTNIQNPPRKPGVRECVVPAEGNVLVSIDYATLELCVTAHQLYTNLGHSKMREAINAGKDLHATLGAEIWSATKSPITYEEFIARLEQGDPEIKYYRQLAKPINLGYPGGIGPKTMMAQAKDSYDVEMSWPQAKQFKELFFQTFPEIEEYFKTWMVKRLFCGYATNGQELYAYTINKRYRHNCFYTEVSNGFLMQSLAADGFKYAMIDIFTNEATQPIRIPFHDEFVFELPNDSTLEATCERLAFRMINQMQKALPSVRISTEVNIMKDGWTKDGEGIVRTMKYTKPNLI